MHDLAPLLGRDPEHRDVIDLGVLLQRRLDLGGVDVHAAGDDHVGLAVADVQVALVVPVGDVADRVVVAAAVRLVAGVVLVVGVERALGPHEYLAGVVGAGAGDLVAVDVEQRDLDAGSRLAAGPRLAHLVRGQQHGVHAELGRPVHLEQRLGREVRHVLLLERVAPRGRVGDHDAHGGAVVALLDLLGQRADHPDERGRGERRARLVLVHQPQPVLGVELALDDDGLAEEHAGAHERAGPAVVQRAGGDVDVVGPVGEQTQQAAEKFRIGGTGPDRALRLAGRAGGVDHRPACADCVADVGRIGRGGRDVGVGQHPVRSLRVRAADRDDVPHLLQPVPQRGEHGRVLVVHVGDLGVAVVDDVERLLRRQPVVQRHGDRTDLPRCAHDRHDLGRVRPAPQDLLARPGPQREQQVRYPVRLCLELGVRPGDDGPVRLVVDDGRLVRLALRVDRKDVVRHRTCPS